MTSFKFPWLLSNVLDVHTNEPLGGAHRSLVLEWQGVRVGLVGLVEREWLLTIPSLEADKDILFLDFVEEGRKLARELRAQGADIVVALTHMRAPNDHLLAAEVPEIQLVLGGHDHDYLVERTEPHGTMLIKSGTDFREFSVIRLKVPPAGPAPTANGAAAGAAGVPPRLELTCEKVDVVASTPEAPDVAAVVADYQAVMGTRMDEPLGRSFLDLDAKFDTVRTRESNVGNLLGDIMRLGLGADAAFLNGGTIRSDAMHAAGRLTMRDFVSMLPFTDELVVLRLSGADVLMALETGVSSWPKREGRFLQVSGISFKFDSERPPGGRVLRDSVVIAGEPLDLDRVYKVATKAYLRSGKDGFDALKRAQVEVDGETAPRLATLCHYLLSRIEQLNIEQGCNTDDSANARQRGEKLVNGSANGASVNGSSVAVAPAAVQSGSRRRSLFAVSEAPLPPAPCAHGLDALYRYDRVSGQFGIAPEVEGRIVNVATQKS